MRLRYIYLPDYGPLKEVAVVFQQNEHIENRTGAINFVVGLNGSGKSSLLRAIYDIFHSLSQEELPKFPVTLAYDIYDKTYQTVIFHRPRGAASESVIWSAHECLSFATAEEWQDHIEYLSSAMMANPEFIGDYVSGDRLKGDGNLRAWLPARVLAYTSGDLKPWQSMAYPVYPADELKDDPDDFNRNQERPCGWTADQERAYRRGDFGLDDKLSMGETEPVGMEGRCMLLTAEDVQLAALSLGLWQAAMELDEQGEESQQGVFRKKLLAQLDTQLSVTGARRLLNELDWLRATHASFLFSSHATQIRHPDAAVTFWLHALADTVLQYPMGESLSVLTLGSRPPLRPEELIGDELLEDSLKLAGEPMRNARCGAEALRCLLGDDRAPDKSLWNIFQKLRSWRSYGLLKDVQFTVKRIRQVPDADDQLDDCIISYSSFSDGEQMLLGRMALLLLLRKQDNSLLLLDEPETHFNDNWKRQIIDIVDDSILKDAFAQVLVATHTSLALTDVFSCEITRFVKEKGLITAQPVVFPTFGADPGRILLHVFGAPDVIGARAAEFLRSKLDPAKWPLEDREKLKLLIDEIGSGWPRAKLMEILERLDNADVTQNS